MVKITFDKLKENCVREFCSKNTRFYINAGLMGVATVIDLKQSGGKLRPYGALRKEIEDDCVKTIERTDIRNLTPLISLCPDSIPQWIKNGNYALDLTDKGWEFFKK